MIIQKIITFNYSTEDLEDEFEQAKDYYENNYNEKLCLENFNSKTIERLTEYDDFFNPWNADNIKWIIKN